MPKTVTERSPCKLVSGTFKGKAYGSSPGDEPLQGSVCARTPGGLFKDILHWFLAFPAQHLQMWQHDSSKHTLVVCEDSPVHRQAAGMVLGCPPHLHIFSPQQLAPRELAQHTCVTPKKGKKNKTRINSWHFLSFLCFQGICCLWFQ